MELVPTLFLEADYTAIPNVSLQITTKKENQHLSLSNIVRCEPRMSDTYKLLFGFNTMLAHSDSRHQLLKILRFNFLITILTVFIHCRDAIVAMVMGDFRRRFLPKPFLKQWLDHYSLVASKWDLVVDPNQTQRYILVDNTAFKAPVLVISTIISR